MVKRQARRSDEIMLIPFLDILCSLIGVLVLIIVVLVVAQTQKINGRSPEEVKRAEEHQKLKKQQNELERQSVAILPTIEQLARLKVEAKEREQDAIRLRRLLDTTAADREKQKALSQLKLKELDNLLLEIEGLGTQEPPLKKEIAALMEEIKKRQPTPVKGPTVVVQPGGSGMAKGSKVFFIEATAGKLTYYWNADAKSVVSAVSSVVTTDVTFNNYLKAVKGVPQSKVIFLLRDDGMGAYNLGAGWAQSNHGYAPEQIGKLPIPGRGEIDLKMFKDFLGSLPPPPPAPKPSPAAPAAPPK